MVDTAPGEALPKTHFGSSNPLTLSLSLRERIPPTERRTGKVPSPAR